MICVLLFLCFFGPPPATAIPDGAGGFVPFTNARVMPDGSLRPYDPAIDGIMGPDGRVYFPPPPTYPPGAVTIGPLAPTMPAPAPRHVPPAHAAKPSGAGHPCYDQKGAPVDPMPPDCQTQSAPEPPPAPAPGHDRGA